MLVTGIFVTGLGSTTTFEGFEAGAAGFAALLGAVAYAFPGEDD
jgi:hypothetical protein